MTKDQVRIGIGVLLGWVVALAAGMVLVTADLLPFRVAFVTPGQLFLGLVQIELFFVLLVWPVVLPALLEKGSAAAALVIPLLALVLALPLAIACAGVSHVGAGGFALYHGLVAAAALCVAAIFHLGRRLGWTVAPWYLLGALTISSLPPFLEFLLREHDAGAAVPALRSVSPFFAAADPGAALVHLLVLAGLAALLGAISAGARKSVKVNP